MNYSEKMRYMEELLQEELRKRLEECEYSNDIVVEIQKDLSNEIVEVFPRMTTKEQQYDEILRALHMDDKLDKLFYIKRKDNTDEAGIYIRKYLEEKGVVFETV